MPAKTASCVSQSNPRKSLDDETLDQRMTGAVASSPIGVIAAGGVMPFAVADSLVARGVNPVLFALRGACDPHAV